MAKEAQAGTTAVWKSRWRYLVSVLLLVHLAAVFLPPFAFASRSRSGQASPLAAAGMDGLDGYIEAMFLDHGYFFFAPNPGASHLLVYEVPDGQGGRKVLRMPDLERHRPRLLYHRHFMLAESLHTAYAMSEVPEGPPPPPPVLARSAGARRVYERQREAFRHHLESRYGEPVRLWRLEHRPPDPYEFLIEGRRLDAPELYRELTDIPSSSLQPGGPSP